MSEYRYENSALRFHSDELCFLGKFTRKIFVLAQESLSFVRYEEFRNFRGQQKLCFLLITNSSSFLTVSNSIFLLTKPFPYN